MTSHTTQQHAYGLRQQKTVLTRRGVFKSHQVGFSPADALTGKKQNKKNNVDATGSSVV